MSEELHDEVHIASVRLFPVLPDEATRAAFVERASADTRDALAKYDPEKVQDSPLLARMSPEEREHTLERLLENLRERYAELASQAAGNEQLFTRWREAAARGDAAEADGLFREIVLARRLAEKHIAAARAALNPPMLVDLGEAMLPGGVPLRLVAQTGHSGAIRALSFTPDGRWLVTASDDGRAIAWDAAAGREVRTWWLADGRLTGTVTSVALSEDGAELVARNDQGHTLRWAPPGRPWVEWSPPAGAEPDRIHPVLQGGTSPLEAVLGAAGPAAQAAVGAFGEPVLSAALSPASALLAAGTASGALRVLDTGTGEVVWSAPSLPLAVRRITWSEDGRRFEVTGDDGTVYGWDAAAGRLAEVRPPAQGGADPQAAAPPPAGRFTLERTPPEHPFQGQLVRDRETGTLLGYIESRRGSEVVHLEPTRTGDHILVLHEDGSACFASLPAAPEWLLAPKILFAARLRHATAAALSPDGRLVLVGREDGALQLWDPKARQRLCHAIGLPDGRWAVSDDDGRYDASNGGAAAGLHWVVGAEIIELEQLKARYYDPFLLAKKLGRHAEPPREIVQLAPKLPPAISHAIEETSRGPELHLVVRDRGGGIGPVTVALNGKEAFVCRVEGGEVKVEPRVDFDGWREAELRSGPGGAREMACSFLLDGHPYLVPGERALIRVIASDEEGALTSREARRRVQVGAGPSEPPHLWAIVAGVSRYAGEGLRLRYSAKDAEDIAVAISLGAPPLFGADRVHLRVLTTERASPADQPTRANLEAAFREARAAAAGDVLLWYFAGHGVQHREGADDDFYLLTQEAETGDLAGADARRREAISSEELTAWLQQIPALKQVLVLDSCHAGQLAIDLAERRDVPSSHVRALERMKDRAGVFVLAGAAADAVSFEASRYAQGLLTHALLFGMRGPALRDGELVDVQRLATFAVDEVPRLAEGIGGVQRPVLATPTAGASFDIGVLPEEARARIPVAEPLPVVVRGAFQDRDEMDDTIGLGEALDAALRERCEDPRTARFVFVPAASFPGAHRLLGAYSISGGEVSVTVRLTLGAARLLDGERFEGPRDAPAELAQRIAAAVVARLL